jgi:hypothetical protein
VSTTEERITITKVALTADGRATARVNGCDVHMMNPLGGWLVTETGRELVAASVVARLNKKVKSLRKGETVDDD